MIRQSSGGLIEKDSLDEWNCLALVRVKLDSLHCQLGFRSFWMYTLWFILCGCFWINKYEWEDFLTKDCKAPKEAEITGEAEHFSMTYEVFRHRRKTFLYKCPVYELLMRLRKCACKATCAHYLTVYRLLAVALIKNFRSKCQQTYWRLAVHQPYNNFVSDRQLLGWKNIFRLSFWT